MVCYRDQHCQGRGVLTCAKTGNVYDCTWEESKRSGLGIVLFVATGDFYKGLF